MIKVAVFSTKPYDRKYLLKASESTEIEWHFFEARLREEYIPLVQGCTTVCCFVNDDLHARVIELLAKQGITLIAMRCAGINNVDLEAAELHGIKVMRVPAYSPYSIAEHAIGLIMDLNRNIHRAHNRVREGDFSLNGLLGYDLHGKQVGIIGTGKIGATLARILHHGFGAEVVGYDPYPSEEFRTIGGVYVTLKELFHTSNVISLHCPLTPQTYHLIDRAAIDQMRHGVMLINTSRGGLIDAVDVIEGLKSGKIGYLGLDVYEEEAGVFFENLSDTIIQDDTLARLMTFPNVTITSHQGFFTHEALKEITSVTVQNILSSQLDQG